MSIRQTLIVAALCVVLGELSPVVSPAIAQTAVSRTPSGSIALSVLLELADRHPEVSIARAETEAAAGGVVAADRAPLPQISASAASIDLQNGVGPGSWMASKRLDKGLGIDWTWERGDKRLHRTRSAEHSLDAARLSQTDTLLQRRIAIASSFWELLAAQDRESDSRELLQGAEMMADVARKRLEKGDISEQEAARVLIETERARSDDATFRAARRLAAITLAQSSGLTDSDLKAEPSWPDVSTTADADRASLADMVRQRPDVNAARARLEAARSALNLARSLQTADITWGGGFNNYPPDQRASVQLRAQIPWQINYRYEGEIRQAAAGVQRAEDGLRQVISVAESELASLLLRRTSTAHRITLLESTILPRAREVLQRAESAYAKGAIPLTELLDARRTYRGVLIDAVEARLEAARSDSEWRLRAGLPLR